ncbi:hypothetical protein EJ05DRAFT_502747 [Pseudovirgaria hyperparasitica]|uniref:Cytosolic endo-beta-N-acetylglucosaminidase TIM barrel domain-containing protein n=1 Tax=Pseudovirgaria hyperparasitica TaxID=470096 RepID=A0A6A6W2E0_9PEZI|nr:uncharacterized protein EJ05DRAFT_502747 [Pseudovirgaria hyperparasitica]KAF2756289.1 hypothetical protein EJ05DRAFT_502747 [Pseudovirgaria hyperparasitica]
MDLLPAGWKDILRPIRDGFRDGFGRAPRDPSPTPRERRQQRSLDALKGFAYFDTFDQVQDWSAESVDPLQTANTPLIKSTYEAACEEPRARILLCHDASGNYHDYEAVQGSILSDEEYTCEHLQSVDVFVYFSHKLACTPPSTWTNHLHRNGVKVLGTLLVERDLPGYEGILESWQSLSVDGEKTHYPLAHQLASMASVYGFDGWLVNLEHPFPRRHWNLHALLGFLEQLKTDMKEHCELVWYDALTATNEVNYQNRLSLRNLAFAKAAGSILTNYRWTGEGASSSIKLAQEHQIPLSNIFFGIDVWAQNTHTTGPKRVTYPSKGGGGTNTGLGVAKLAELNLSAGIFAPAWSFEHFPSQGRNVEKAMWHGTELPPDTHCDCADASVHRDSSYKNNPISRYAQQRPAGSLSYFYTDFERGFAPLTDTQTSSMEGKGFQSRLAHQSILPDIFTLSQPPECPSSPNLIAHLQPQPSRLQIIRREPSGRSGPGANMSLPLFRVSLKGYLRLQVNYTLLSPLPPNHIIKIYVKLRKCQTNMISFELPVVPAHEQRQIYTNIYESLNPGHDRFEAVITEIGVEYIVDDAKLEEDVPGPQVVDGNIVGSRTPLIDIHSLAILPPGISRLACEIGDIRVLRHLVDDTEQLRLAWSFTESDDCRIAMLPRSNMTGPFAHFDVRIDELPVQRTYALQYIFQASSVQKLRGGDKVEVQITGIGYDGQMCASKVLHISLG